MGPLILVLFLLAQAHLRQDQSDHAVITRNPRHSAMETLRLNGIPVTISEARPTPYPGQMTMLSIFAGLDEQESGLKVSCKADRAMSNIDAYIAISGVVQEDVVSIAGKILIPAGSKVFGQGYCDAQQARVLSRGRWTFYLSDHLVVIQGALRDMENAEGLAGEEISAGLDENRVKRAIYRDGIYLYVPSETEFVLDLRGAISVQDLPSAYGK